MSKEMKKSILMSFSPYYYYLIGEGIKKIEVRKTVARDPDWNGIVECYMTKDKRSFNRIPKEFQEKYRAHMGKVGMRFVCDWTAQLETVESYQGQVLESSIGKDFSETALTKEEIINYAGRKFKSKTDYWVEYLYFCYGWHISDLIIYNKPKELKNYVRCQCKYMSQNPNLICDCYCYYGSFNCFDRGGAYKQLARPPQSWRYIDAK